MHEFLLFGHVANNERQRLLQQLAGVTRMQPKHVAERHLLFKARPPVGLGNIPSAGGSQGVLSAEIQRTKQMLTSSIFYIQLVCTLEEEKAPVEDHSHSNGVLNGYATLEEAKANGARSDHCENKGGKWAIEFRDIPDPGKQPVTTRLMSRTQVEGHDMFAFVKNLGFEYVLCMKVLESLADLQQIRLAVRARRAQILRSRYHTVSPSSTASASGFQRAGSSRGIPDIINWRAPAAR